MYAKCIKRILDFFLSLIAVLLLSPLLLVLTVIGAIKMKGNPFFVQPRVGQIDKKTGKETIFSMVKFRSMRDLRDENGKLLPDQERLTRYGRFLRKTSLDELPQLINIICGDLSICGPRPLVTEYLPCYTPEEHHRHDVKPGVTGLAQINGRSFITWEEIFAYDLEYVRTVSLRTDLHILLQTVKKVVAHENIADMTQLQTDENGRKYAVINGEKKYLHQPLNIERGLQSAAGNRK